MKALRFHPGETVVVNFLIPFRKDDVATVVMSIRDHNYLVFEAASVNVVAAGENKTRVGYTFTQSESLLFREYWEYQLELNVFSYNSSRATSKDIPVITGSQHIYESSDETDPELIYAWRNKADADESTQRPVSYEQLTDLPSLNQVTLIGDRTVAETAITTEEIAAILGE